MTKKYLIIAIELHLQQYNVCMVMKTNMRFLNISFLLIFFAAACNPDTDAINDRDAPQIDRAEGYDEIHPVLGFETSDDADHLSVKFSVHDPSGINQIKVGIHSGFDGHSHARLSNEFVQLNVSDIYSAAASDPAFQIEKGVTSVNIDDVASDIYWEGDRSRVDGNVLAGPYHFSIEASDVHGNQTSHADHSIYSTTFVLHRPYAPVVTVTNLSDGELEGEAGQQLAIAGSIETGNHALGSALKFVWIRLTEEGGDDDHSGHDHRVAQGDLYEGVWGTSTWRKDVISGGNLTDNASVDLATILSNDISLPNDHAHLELIIWAEDINGNITRRTFPVHVH